MTDRNIAWRLGRGRSLRRGRRGSRRWRRRRAPARRSARRSRRGRGWRGGGGAAGAAHPARASAAPPLRQHTLAATAPAWSTPRWTDRAPEPRAEPPLALVRTRASTIAALRYRSRVHP